jgi:hypothetical protein
MNEHQNQQGHDGGGPLPGSQGSSLGKGALGQETGRLSRQGTREASGSGPDAPRSSQSENSGDNSNRGDGDGDPGR